MMSDDLLPCPFCGGERIHEGYTRDGRTVSCRDCGAGVLAFLPNASETARAKWNTRREAATRLSAQPAEVEAVEGVARAREVLGAIAEGYKWTLSDDGYVTVEAYLKPGTNVLADIKFRAALAVRPSGTKMREDAWLHVKTGGVYDVVGLAKMQCSEPQPDMASVVVYRSRKDGRLWARAADEFHDGRFRFLPLSPEEEGRT